MGSESNELSNALLRTLVVCRTARRLDVFCEHLRQVIINERRAPDPESTCRLDEDGR